MRFSLSRLLVLVLLLLVGWASPAMAADEPAPKPIEEQIADAATAGKIQGDTAWMLVSTALVMFMVPGLALFYGGMVRRKNMLATMMQSMVALGIVGVYWVAVGYALAFGPSVIGDAASGTGIVGWSWDLFFMKGIAPDQLLPGYNIPIYTHMMFQGMFAIITPALISGAFAERVKFGPYLIFTLLWVTFVYCPLAHMVWSWNWFQELTVMVDGKEEIKALGAMATGLLGGKMQALDFAGGTVVHIAAGFAGLATVLMLKKRHGYPTSAFPPGSMVLTLTGAAILWFGWFGFNGGSATASGTLASSAFAATQAAAAAAALSWIVTEWLIKGKPTALGLASGMVAGLVAVTPASGYVYVWGGLIIGLIAGVVCYLAVLAKGVLGYDDSLDAFGVHGVGGFLGAILTGLLCAEAVNSAAVYEADSYLDAGSMTQFFNQLIASVGSALFAFLATIVLVKIVDIVFGMTTDVAAETEGLDRAEHGETSFDFGVGIEGTPTVSAGDPRPAVIPPNGKKRFTLVVEGSDPTTVMKAWAEVCQPGVSTDAEFVKLYPHLTTVSGNKFRFKDGDAKSAAQALGTLLQKRLGRTPISVRVES